MSYTVFSLPLKVLCRYQSKWPMKLEFKPFFLGGIMQGSGDFSANTYYIFLDISFSQSVMYIFRYLDLLFSSNFDS